jgi:tRNA1(Val) A37 N6-methylase TrmN6
MSHWLAPEGMLSMLVPYETLGQLEHLNLDKTTHLLFLKQAQTIRAFQDSKPHLAVVHFQKKNCDYRIIEPLIVYDKPNQFTDESKRVLQAFLQERALK